MFFNHCYEPLKTGKKIYQKNFDWNFILRIKKKVIQKLYPLHFDKYLSESILCVKSSTH